MRALRVRLHHAAAIASRVEIELVERVAGVAAPAVVWTIKEAVYKATSKPLQRFLSDGRILSCTSSEAGVLCARSEESAFTVRWLLLQGFVAAFAIGVDRFTDGFTQRCTVQRHPKPAPHLPLRDVAANRGDHGPTLLLSLRRAFLSL